VLSRDNFHAVLEVFPSFKIAVEMLARSRMRTTDTLQVHITIVTVLFTVMLPCTSAASVVSIARTAATLAFYWLVLSRLLLLFYHHA
jgi:hypothetical protein